MFKKLIKKQQTILNKYRHTDIRSFTVYCTNPMAGSANLRDVVLQYSSTIKYIHNFWDILQQQQFMRIYQTL